MSIILKDVNSKKEVLIEGITYKYLYQIFFVINCQFDLNMDYNKPVSLPDKVLIVLYERIGEQISFLLETCPHQPDASELKKRPGWHEKIVYMGNTYTVNNTTSGIGRLLYSLNSRLRFIKEVIDSESSLSITTLDL